MAVYARGTPARAARIGQIPGVVLVMLDLGLVCTNLARSVTVSLECLQPRHATSDGPVYWTRFCASRRRSRHAAAGSERRMMPPRECFGQLVPKIPKRPLKTQGKICWCQTLSLADKQRGIQMSASGDHTLGPAHAHLNLVGWATLGLFGVYDHLVPKTAER